MIRRPPRSTPKPSSAASDVYKRQILIKGEVSQGRLQLQEAVMDSPAMKMVATGEVDLLTEEADLTVLVAPLKSVDTLLSHVPLLGPLLTGRSGTFLSVPYRVRGKLSDPQITPLPPSAVGNGLLGLMKRTLRLPAEALKPLLP